MKKEKIEKEKQWKEENYQVRKESEKGKYK